MKNINNQLVNLATKKLLASKMKNWVGFYDRESDSLTITEPKMQSDVNINYLNDDVAVFVTPNKDIKGFFIEYFTKNFLRHNQVLNSIKDEIKANNQQKNQEELLKIKKNNVKNLLEQLQLNIRDQISHQPKTVS